MTTTFAYAMPQTVEQSQWRLSNRVAGAALATFLSLCMVACGGGGGGALGPGDPSPPQGPQDPPDPGQPVTPGIDLPLTVGSQWIYRMETENVVVASSTGVHRRTFAGVRIVRVMDVDSATGEAVIEMYDVEDQPDSQSRLRVDSVRLENRADGLYKHGTSGAKQVLSYGPSTFGPSSFWMAGGPSHGPKRSVMTASSTQVPYGDFATLRSHYEFRQTGAYVSNDIFEDRWEHYVDGVGLVRAEWDYHNDSNDPQGTDVFSRGSVVLTHFNQGPFPYFVEEADPNDSWMSANWIDANSIVTADTDLDDPGQNVYPPLGNSQNPNPPPSLQVESNVNGEPRLQDWFRLDIGAPTDLRVDLSFGGDDLDLYLLQRITSGLYAGSYIVVARSVRPPGNHEFVEVQDLPAGTYFIAVQAWETAGRRDYWLGTRTDID